MRLIRRMLLPFALFALGLAGPAVASASAHGRSRVVGHVYVNDNTAGTNTIAAFDRHADGSLTPEAGSPFAAGGAGTGSGLASQGAIQMELRTACCEPVPERHVPTANSARPTNIAQASFQVDSKPPQ